MIIDAIVCICTESVEDDQSEELCKNKKNLPIISSRDEHQQNETNNDSTWLQEGARHPVVRIEFPV